MTQLGSKAGAGHRKPPPLLGRKTQEEERQRLVALQNGTYRIVEKKQKEQAAHDANQIREVDARFKAFEGQNRSKKQPSVVLRRR